jgi:hypothetical protein
MPLLLKLRRFRRFPWLPREFSTFFCRHNQTWPRTADCYLPVKPSVRSRAAALRGLEDRRTKMDLMEAGRILRPRP